LRSERDALVQQTHPLRAEIARSNATSASVPVPPTSAVSSPVSPANLRQYVGAHPDLRPLFLEQVALKVRTQYSPFFRAAHVSAEQQEAFVKLSIKPMIMNLDLDNALRAFGENRPSADTPAGAQLMDTVKKNAAELKTDATEGMRQIFGDEIYAAYQKYHDTISERGIAESLAGQLYYSLTPITAEQGDKLVTILAQSRFDPKSAQSSENSIAGSTILPSEVARYTSDKNPPLGPLITDGALTRAQAILTPDQIIALKRLQMQQLLEIQLQPENAKERSP